MLRLLILVCLPVLMPGSVILAFGEDAGASAAYEWCRKNPENVGSFASSIVNNGIGLEKLLDEDTRGQIAKSLDSAQDSLEFLSSVGQLALERDDLPVADAISQNVTLEKRKRLLKENPDMVNAENQILRDDARRPRDAVIEFNFPADVAKTQYLAVDDGMNRADWLLAQSSFGAPDLAYVRAWRDRLGWVVGEEQVSPLNSDDGVWATGRLMINEQPARMVRVVLMKPQEGFISGGGYRSFVKGLDTVLGPDIEALPEDNFYSTFTDASGKFRLKIRPGGPYCFVALTVQRAITRIRDARISVAGGQGYRKNLGWEVIQQQDEQDLGTISVKLNSNEDTTESRALLDARTLFNSRKVYRGDRIEFPLRLTNQGKEPLEVSGLKTDCGCSAVFDRAGGKVPVKLPVSLAPSESVVFYMAVTTNSITPLGLTRKAVLVATNDAFASHVRLECVFRTDDLVRLEPALVKFDISDKPVSRLIRLVSGGGIERRLVQTTPDSASPLKVVIAADGKSANVSVDPGKLPDGSGSYFEELELSLDGEGYPPIRLPVYCRRTGSLSAEPSSLNFRVVRKGSQLKRSVTLSSPKEFKGIKSIESVLGAMEVVRFELTQSKLEVEVQLVGEGPDRLRITLDDESHSQIEIPVSWKFPDD